VRDLHCGFKRLMGATFLGKDLGQNRSSTYSTFHALRKDPAISMGGGSAGGAHTFVEWFDPAGGGREMV